MRTEAASQKRNGFRHGLGTYRFPNGCRYEGVWSNGKQHGHGVLYYKDGQRYEGSFANGDKHGQGFHCGPNFVAHGMWAYDKQHGQGRFVFADGSEAQGEFISGNKEGVWTLVAPPAVYGKNVTTTVLWRQNILIKFCDEPTIVLESRSPVSKITDAIALWLDLLEARQKSPQEQEELGV